MDAWPEPLKKREREKEREKIKKWIRDYKKLLMSNGQADNLDRCQLALSDSKLPYAVP